MHHDLDTIHREARAAREITYAWTARGLDLVKLCRAHGLVVRVVALEGDVDGILAHKDGRWLVVVNRRTNWTAARRRFTMAHELGHYRLHRHRQQLFMCSRLDRSRMEWEANRFAVELLLPEDRMRDMLAAGWDARRISRVCGVSLGTVRRRLKEIRTLTAEWSPIWGRRSGTVKNAVGGDQAVAC